MQRLTIPGPAGALEALLEVPASFSGGAAAVLCHPHPLYGGTMRNKVVARMAQALLDCGLAALRFNFRGVEASEGSHDAGKGEVARRLRRRGLPARGPWPPGGSSWAAFPSAPGSPPGPWNHAARKRS